MGPPPAAAGDEGAVRLLASVSGISEDRARLLVARGFRDFADLVRLALPESAVKRGLHHAIARRAMLAELEPKEVRAPSGDRCPVCAAPRLSGADRCATCGSTASTGLVVETVGQKIEEVTQEIVTLTDDEDFREMPEDVRKDLLAAFAGLTPEDVLREEYGRQLDAWREKGFDVAPLEKLLATDLDEFRERSVRLIRAQILKKAEAGSFRCPLCDVRLPAATEQCENCGAKFV